MGRVVTEEQLQLLILAGITTVLIVLLIRVIIRGIGPLYVVAPCVDHRHYAHDWGHIR